MWRTKYRGGIGKATAIALAKQGCAIAVHYHSASDAANALVAKLEALNGGAKCASFKADLGDYDEVKRLHREVVDELGHPDILFNNAGIAGTRIGPKGDIEKIGIEEFEYTWKVNTGASFLVNTNSVLFLCSNSICSLRSCALRTW